MHVLRNLPKFWWTIRPRSNPATGWPLRPPPRPNRWCGPCTPPSWSAAGIRTLLLELPDQDEILFARGKDEQLDAIPTFRKLAYDQFESRIRIHSATNPRALSGVDPARQKRRQKALGPILEAQMRRGADRSFKWVTTLFPTEGFAREAGMSLAEFEDFVYHACHADEADPVAYWKKVEDPASARSSSASKDITRWSARPQRGPDACPSRGASS